MDDVTEINRSLVKILPRKYTKKSLEKIIGPIRYELDIEAINKSVNEPIWDLLDRGGKRWRPILFLTIVELLGKNPKDFVDLSVIFEIIHNGSLIIDDFEDQSEMRRGRRTIHLLFGSDIAINAGNLIYFLPLKILDKYKGKIKDKVRLEIYQTYLDEMVTLGLGQSMDLAWHSGLVDGFKITEDQYLQMCAFKTGGLARMAVKVAALISDADKKIVQVIGRLGESLGVVFQIQDDILNITESKLSDLKGLGEDITEGKRSLPVIYALKNLPKKEGKRLNEILLMHTLDGKLIKEAIGLIVQGKGIMESQKTMGRLFKGAWDELEPLLTNNEGKKKLYQLSNFLIKRQI